MDRVDRVAVDRVQSVTVGYPDAGGEQVMPPGQLLTGDHNLVNVRATLYYKVRPEEVAEYVAATDQVEGLMTRVAETVLAEWVASRTVDDVLLRGKHDLGPALAAGTQQRLGPYRLGVEVLDARVALIAPPDEVKHAFDEVARAQTAIVTLTNRAEQEAEAALRTALSDKFRLEQTTAAYAHGQRLLARREADRFLDRLRQFEASRRTNPAYLRQIWEEERGRLFARLKENGQLGLLDHHLGADGLDLSIAPALPKK
jgi:membrane protease subunit HflK